MKKLIAFTSIICLATLAFVGCAAPDNAPQDNTPAPAATSESAAPTTPQSGGITLEQAKQIALADAQVTEEQVTFLHVQPDQEDGASVYEIDFNSADSSFEYEIRADGTIATMNHSGLKSASVSFEDAKAIALKHANATATNTQVEAAKKHNANADSAIQASDATFTKVEQKIENDLITWDLEFTANNVEYDYTINANNGQVLEYGSEPLTKK